MKSLDTPTTLILVTLSVNCCIDPGCELAHGGAVDVTVAESVAVEAVSEIEEVGVGAEEVSSLFVYSAFDDFDSVFCS